MSNDNLTLPDWKYNDYFKHQFKTDKVDFPIVKEKHYHYNPDQFGNLQNNINIIGWLQSEKYWNSDRAKIKKLFEFKDELVTEIKNKYGNLLSKKTVAISIRRGDYVDNPNYHLLPIQYYYLALFEHFPNWRNYNILIFSDDPEYCHVHFECVPNATVIKDSPINQLCLGSMCDGFIVANSTFSWWMAYLGKGKVIRPNYLFEGNLKYLNSDKDFWPNDWIPFDYKGKKLPAKDVTFMIPVSYDHP
ncbi:MAG TPA: alpha-1,2-fucosyltransferase, partial [Allocoleopsis sp.]